jgi:hypothetical protein
LDNNKKIVLEALERSKGIVTDACKAVLIPRSTFYHWMQNDIEFKQAVDDIQELAIDYVEGKLFEKIEGITMLGKESDDPEGEPIVYKVPPSDAAIIFFLKTKAKKRGYIEKQDFQISGNPDSPLLIDRIDYNKLPDQVLKTILQARISTGDEQTS